MVFTCYIHYTLTGTCNPFYITYYSHICFPTCFVHSNKEVIPLYPLLHYIHMFTCIIIYICLHVLYIHVHVIYRLLYAPNINIPAFIVHATCERVVVLLRLMVEHILDMHMLYYITIIQSNINVHVVHVNCDTSIFHCMYSISYVY